MSYLKNSEPEFYEIGDVCPFRKSSILEMMKIGCICMSNEMFSNKCYFTKRTSKTGFGYSLLVKIIQVQSQL